MKVYVIIHSYAHGHDQKVVGVAPSRERAEEIVATDPRTPEKEEWIYFEEWELEGSEPYTKTA